MIQAVIIIAGLMGAAGVVLSAAAAHGHPGSGLESAGYLLLFHAAAVLGGASVIHEAIVWRALALVALAGFVIGSVLFASDIALRAFTGHRLFPMAAPIGGFTLIAGWLVLAVAAVAAR